MPLFKSHSAKQYTIFLSFGATDTGSRPIHLITLSLRLLFFASLHYLHRLSPLHAFYFVLSHFFNLSSFLFHYACSSLPLYAISIILASSMPSISSFLNSSNFLPPLRLYCLTTPSFHHISIPSSFSPSSSSSSSLNEKKKSSSFFPFFMMT